MKTTLERSTPAAAKVLWTLDHGPRYDLHPHVDVLGGIHCVRKWVMKGRVDPLIIPPVLPDLLLREARILVVDELGDVTGSQSIEVKVATAMDQRYSIHVLIEHRTERERKRVVVRTWAIVNVIYDRPTIALINVAGAIVANPNRVGGSDDEDDLGKVHSCRR